MVCVSGNYNVSDRRGNLFPWSVRSAKQLASTLLAALGVTAASMLPEDSFPPIIWEHTPAEEALDNLHAIYDTTWR